MKLSQPLPPLPDEDLTLILEQTRDLWAELRGQQIFITGGTGFFGCWLLESFARANQSLGLGARAVVLTRNPGVFAAKVPHLTCRSDIELVSGDVRDFVFPAGIYSHVIHAGTATNEAVEPQEMFDTIVDGSRRVLQFAAERGTRKLLFVSSGAVYGRQPSDLTHIPEDFGGGPDPLDVASAYGEGKRAAEQLSMLATQRTHCAVKVARCFAFVGPHLPLDGQFAIGNFIRDVLAGQPIQVRGDGTPYRSYLYAADLVAWLWTILVRGTPARAYNVGSNQAVSIAQLAELVQTALNCAQPVRVNQSPVPGQPSSRYVPDVNRAATELGLQGAIPLNEAICRTANWWRAAV